MKALVLNCTLKPSPATSNTEALARVVTDELSSRGVESEFVRVVDHDVVVTGNEDGAHHVISEIAGGLIDIGYTIPGQAWTYWNQGPGPGPTYLDEEGSGQEWSQTMARTAAAKLAAAARALGGSHSPRRRPERRRPPTPR